MQQRQRSGSIVNVYTRRETRATFGGRKTRGNVGYQDSGRKREKEEEVEEDTRPGGSGGEV